MKINWLLVVTHLIIWGVGFAFFVDVFIRLYKAIW